MKHVLYALILFGLTYRALADSIKKNEVYLEFGGACYNYSINYERKIYKGLNGRIGYKYENIGFNSPSIQWNPVLLSYYLKNTEIGGGVIFTENESKLYRSSDAKLKADVVVFIGYKIYLSERIFLKTNIYYFKEFRLDINTFGLIPGISFGYGF